MSIKQLVKSVGVRHFVSINPILTNWVIEARSASYQDLDPSPVRVGPKRVVLSTNREFGRSNSLVRILAVIMMTVMLAALTILSLPKPETQAKLTTQECSEFSGADLTLDESLQGQWKNWRIDFALNSRSGNIVRFKFSARCGSRTSNGMAYAVQRESNYQIKKMVPSK